MDRTIATALLQQELAAARARGYAALRNEVGNDVTREIVGPDGKEYQISLTVVWDKEENGPIRLIASIDDGGWRAFVPLTSGDLVDPETGPA